MTNNQKITFSYALTYMATGLAINRFSLLSILCFIIAASMLLPQKVRVRDLVFPVITLLFQIGVIIIERAQLASIEKYLLPAIVLCMIHGFLMLLKLIRSNTTNRIAIISGNAIIFLSFSLIMIVMDLIIKQLIPTGGILRGFWLMTILFGSNILASLLVLLAGQTVSLKKTEMKTKLS